MTTQPDPATNRVQRRKQRTRGALIQAAQGFIAAGKLTVPVLEITQAADVGMGSFYNHFQTKDELFAAALTEVLDAHGDLLDKLNESLDDPAEVFARSFRITGRFFRRRPQESRVLLSGGWSMLSADRGLAPRALRDITAAATAGRFRVADPQVALVLAGGVLMGLGQLLHNDVDRDDALTADEVTESLLRLFGMDDVEAQRLCRTLLPDIDELSAGVATMAGRR